MGRWQDTGPRQALLRVAERKRKLQRRPRLEPVEIRGIQDAQLISVRLKSYSGDLAEERFRYMDTHFALVEISQGREWAPFRQLTAKTKCLYLAGDGPCPFGDHGPSRPLQIHEVIQNRHD